MTSHISSQIIRTTLTCLLCFYSCWATSVLAAAEIQSPPPNSKLLASSTTFTWSTPQGATAYDLIVGTNGAGSNDIRQSNVVNTNQLTVDGLPTDGSPIFVRLWTFTTTWEALDYTYTAAGSGFTPYAEMQSPLPGSTFESPTVTFTWNRPASAIDFDLIIGTTGHGSDDIRSSSVFNDTQLTVSNMPTDGSTIYVVLWTYIVDWQYQTYTYTAAGNTSTTPKATMQSPAPNGTLDSTTITFNWDSPTSATGYDLIVGTNGPGSDNIRSSSTTTNTSLAVSGLPSDGSTVYVRLTTLSSSGSAFNDYTYTSVDEGSSTTPPTTGIEGCFIATAAYGSYEHDYLYILRNFRDEILLSFAAGQWFVEQYYNYSPPIAKWIANHNTVKVTTQIALWPVIGLAWFSLASIYQKFAILTGLILLTFMCHLIIKQRRRARQVLISKD